MDDKKKAKLARKGLKAAEMLSPGKLKQKVRDKVAGASKSVAMSGLRALGKVPPQSERSPARTRAVEAVDLARGLDGDADANFEDWDVDDAARFDAQLERAVAQHHATAPSRDLASLRRSFPEASRELALLVFNCVDLLEDLSSDAEGAAPTAAELERKEKLLLRVAQLLAPRAKEALSSFVDHVVGISRDARAT